MAEVAEGSLVDGRYVIKHRIGSGGMADVYCAEDRQLGRDIALKVLHRRFARDQEFVERFRREASAAAGLQHPNVVNVFDRGEHEGTYYIAMENLHGPTLKEVIRTEAPISQERAIGFVIQILQAAGFAHQRGVIHRDFKPHNVIVGQGDRVKVTDFGIARAGASEMTETGSIMGTAQYLSPEQAQGQKVEATSDLYSIGVILFELLTGQVPFSGDSAVSIALKHVSEDPPPVDRIRPGVHPMLANVVAQALAKDPAHRFQTAEEFIAALDAAHAAILAGDNGGGTATWRPPPPPPVFVEEQHDDPRGRRWPFIALALLVLALAAAALTYSLLKTEQVTVPQVVGLTGDRAGQRLVAAGFKVKVESTQSAKRAGRVIAQDPRGGIKADKGSAVTLTVSSGPGQALVPSVVGESEARAVKDLNDSGFRVVLDQTPSSKIAKGLAVKTSPPEGTSADRGSPVRLFVSTGPEQVDVPSVVGKSKASAVAALQDAGLKVTAEEQESAQPKGRVISQSPTGGTTVDRGSRVTITVSQGQPKVSVPDVRGETEDMARSDLIAAGFKVKVVHRESADQPAGQVFEQRPGGNTDQPKGSTVTILVATAPPANGTPPGTTPPTGTATP
ncbi:MAG: eukaryotic-like serine/threonine-protein kinase [Thermoleophilaceae bacterium]|nr:eukaryotic-like serine/threonine-protein kinase [Thermoleophilaceae bacterium]